MDGVGSTTMAFAIEDVDTAVVDTDGETLTVTLTATEKQHFTAWAALVALRQLAG